MRRFHEGQIEEGLTGDKRRLSVEKPVSVCRMRHRIVPGDSFFFFPQGCRHRLLTTS